LICEADFAMHVGSPLVPIRSLGRISTDPWSFAATASAHVNTTSTTTRQTMPESPGCTNPVSRQHSALPRSVSPATPHTRPPGGALSPAFTTTRHEHLTSSHSFMNRQSTSAPDFRSRGSLPPRHVVLSPTSDGRWALPCLEPSTPEGQCSPTLVNRLLPSSTPTAPRTVVSFDVPKPSIPTELAKGGSKAHLITELVQQRDVFAHAFASLERQKSQQTSQDQGCMSVQCASENTADEYKEIYKPSAARLLSHPDTQNQVSKKSSETSLSRAASLSLCDTLASNGAEREITELRGALAHMRHELAMSKEVAAAQEVTIAELRRQVSQLKDAQEHAPREAPACARVGRTSTPCDESDASPSPRSRSRGKCQVEEESTDAVGWGGVPGASDEPWLGSLTPPGSDVAKHRLPRSILGLTLAGEPDEVDTLLVQFLSEHPEFLAAVSKMKKGWYQFDRPMKKKVFLKTAGRDKLVVRVGQRCVPLAKFMADQSVSL